MKQLLTVLFLLLPLTVAVAQPKNAERALLRLTTYGADGRELASVNAFYIDASGNAVSAYRAFRGAVRATVTDARGQSHDVRRILGADANADLVKFSTDAAAQAFLPLISDDAQAASAGSALYLVRPARGKVPAAARVSVLKVEPFNGFNYYEVATANDLAAVSCPLTDAAGRVVAVTQRNLTEGATTLYGVDSRFARRLAITAQSALDKDLREIGIPKALPLEESEALSYVYLIEKLDTAQLPVALSDFTERFPGNAEAYVLRGTHLAAAGDYQAADHCFDEAMQRAGDGYGRDAVSYARSRARYEACLRSETLSAGGWTMADALADAEAAYNAAPKPLYMMQQGFCQYALRDYVAAYNCFNKVNTTDYASPETYYYATLAFERQDSDALKAVALMDSVLARCQRPVGIGEANYLVEHAKRCVRAGLWRRAYKDMTDYENAVGPRNLTDDFYYERSQLAVKAKLFKQALDDIDSAINQSRTNRDFYSLQKALLYLNVGEYAEAEQAARDLLSVLPESGDCYKIMGIAQGEQGRKAEARASLQHALDLGDQTAAEYLQRYK